MAEKKFRADLYHRLAVLRIHLPPLRERLDDIPLLVELFLQQFNARYKKQTRKLTSEAIRLLQSYLWPGNVRELRNVVERVVVESETEAIGARAFKEWIQERQQFSTSMQSESTLNDSLPLPVAVPYHRDESSESLSPISRIPGIKVELTKPMIRQAYHEADGNLSAAARILGVHRATLYRHLKILNLERHELI